MQPPADHVHWMFGAGFLLFGLLLLTEAVVGAEVWREAALARLPVALARVHHGRAHVAGDGVLHQLGHPHGRSRRLGAGDDARRAGPQLGLVRGKLKSRSGS